VEKKVLGRGLRDLLDEKKALPGRDLAVQKEGGNPSNPGTGLRALIGEKNGASGPFPEPSQPPSGTALGVVTFSLLLADVLLLALASFWFLGRSKAPGFFEFSIIFLMIVFGAWLGFLAAWLHFQRD
jgi:hypothetical protein